MYVCVCMCMYVCVCLCVCTVPVKSLDTWENVSKLLTGTVYIYINLRFKTLTELASELCTCRDMWTHVLAVLKIIVLCIFTDSIMCFF